MRKIFIGLIVCLLVIPSAISAAEESEVSQGQKEEINAETDKVAQAVESSGTDGGAQTAENSDTVDDSEKEKESRWRLYLTTDLAYHPKTGYRAGGTHFTGPSGPFRILKPRTRFTAEYKIPVLTGESALFAGNNVTLRAECGLTPVSSTQHFSVTFSPAAFFDLDAGFVTGSGWNIGSFHGIREYNPARNEYDELDSFSTWYLYPFVRATIKFDVGALWPGDWHHIVGLATFETGYQSLIGAKQTVWEWQTFAGNADGWFYRQYYVIGYQMPLKLSMIAMTFDLSGHYNASDYGQFAQSFGGDFMYAEIGPMIEVTLNKKNYFYSLIAFSGRRSFAEPHDEEEVEPSLTNTGTEWFWDYIAVRWVHFF